MVFVEALMDEGISSVTAQPFSNVKTAQNALIRSPSSAGLLGGGRTYSGESTKRARTRESGGPRSVFSR